MDFRIQWLPVIVFAIAVIATLYVWKHYVFPASMVGRVEGIRADVSLPTAGVVTKLYVTRFQSVNAGDRIAEISPVDLKVLEASLGVIRADIDLLRSGVNPTMEVHRIAIDYDQLKLDWLRQKVTVATTRTELQLAEIELGRAERLWKDKIIADADYDTAKTKRDALRTSLQEHIEISVDLENSLNKLLPASDVALDATGKQFKASIAVEEEKLKLTEAQMAPREIKAPISGTISAINKWCGESATAADPVVVISSSESERAIGYLRQPFYITPTTNMMVQIRTRGTRRQIGLGRILAIGQQLLPITDILLPPTKYNVSETGLPILVSLPEELKKLVHPGEFVDLTIVPNAKAAL
jgi:multidrug resistance efflux pump